MRLHLRSLLVAWVTLLLLLPMAPSALAGSFGGSSGGRSSFSSSSSSSRPSSSSSSASKSVYSGSKTQSKTYSSSKSASALVGKSSAASASKPSTGPKQQPVPATRLVPSALPKSFPPSRVPAGHTYSRDRTILIGHPYYLDPYNHSYYGYPTSPYYYLYLASIMGGSNPVAPQGQMVVVRQGASAGVVVLVLVGGLLVGFGIGYLVATSLQPKPKRRSRY